jgi:hypothetical protein
MGSPAYNNPRGMLISMSIFGSSALIGQYNCIKNLLVYNNSAIFIPKGGTGTTNLGNGGLIFTYNTAQATYDSIINCTVANNSMMRIGYGIRGNFSNTTQPYHVIANNVLLDNKNNNGSGTIAVQNLAINQAPAGAAGTITIANNIGNSGISATANANNVFGNITDLSATNNNAKGANFTSPNSINGYSTDASVVLSRWMIASTSYLKGKGVVTLNSTDKAGHSFAATPAVGAYEYASNVITVNINEPATSTSSVNGAGTYDYGSSVTLTVTPHNGKLFSNWTDVSGTLSSNSTYTFVSTKDNTITANITVDPTTEIRKVSDIFPVTVNGQDLIINISGQVEVYNSAGRLVISTKVNDTAVRLNQTGIYLVRVKTQKGILIQKVII